MKQWQLTRFNADNLKIQDVEIPVPGPHELLIRVSAVSLNYRDKLVLEGEFFPNLTFPFVPCSDAAGEVVEVGPSVTLFQLGDRVVTHFFPRWMDGAVRSTDESVSLGGPLPGVLSEFIVAHESAVLATPGFLSDAEASTLPIAALTAWWALFEFRPLRPGEIVLVQGTGGVSLFALQFASAFGARVIITSRDEKKCSQAKDLGAWAAIDSLGSPAWDKEVLSLTNGRGADHVIEVLGGENVRRSLNALARGGQIALVGFLQGRDMNIDILDFMLKFANLRPVGVGHRRAFEAMNLALEAKRIRPVLDTVYAFGEAKQAFEHLTRGPFGKVVIAISPQGIS